jgi:hypothetical protein
MRGIGFCGIDCDTCDLVEGLIGLARKAAELNSGLREMKVSAWAPSVLEGGSVIDFQRLDESLEWIAASLTCPGCKSGGGQQDCSVRLCSRDKGYESCSQCSGLMECSKIDHLNKPDRIKERLLELREHT